MCVEIRPATAGDADAIAAIQASAPEAAQWRSSDYLQYDCSLAVLEGRAIGFLVWRAAADEREILNMAVHPDFRRRGIGAMLLSAVLREAPGCWYLEVRESNTAARELYRKLGFSEISRRPGYYENPPEHAIVLKFFSC